MANTSSAKKAIRVSARKKAINLKRSDEYKKQRKAVLEALKANDIKTAETDLPKAYKAIDKAAKNNTIHKNKASRLKSRLAKAIVQASKSK